jgi:hypothetical protein
MFSLRFLKPTLAAVISLVLGISALVIILILLSALLSLLNWAGVFVSSPEPTDHKWFGFFQGIFVAWAGLLGVAAPIWLLAWLPLCLVRSRWAPWKISKTILIAALVGGVGGVVECVVVFLSYVLYYVGWFPALENISGLFNYAGVCFVIGTIGGTFIGAAETLTSKWFKGKTGEAIVLRKSY